MLLSNHRRSLSAFGSGALVLAAIAVWLLITGTASAATTYFVDPAGNDANACTAPGASACKTVQGGVNKAAAGDTVQVAAGTYTENVTIGTSLTLKGAGAGIDARTRAAIESIINGGAAADITITANNVTVDGFTLNGPSSSGTAALVMQTGNTGETIKNNIINNPGRAASITTSNTTFSQNLVNNTATSSDGFQANSTPIQNLTISNNKFGGADPNVYNADITVIEGNANVVVSGNASNGDGTLIALFKTNGAQITGNTVIGAGFSAIYIGGANTNVTVSGNQVSAASSAVKVANDFGDGVNGSVTVTNNTLQNNSYGVNVNAGSVTSASSVLANLNNLTGNTSFGINNAATGTLDGTCNWWGAANGPGPVGPGSGDKVSTQVTFTPWLIAPAPGGACTGPNTPTPTPSPSPTPNPTFCASCPVGGFVDVVSGGNGGSLSLTWLLAGLVAMAAVSGGVWTLVRKRS